MVERLNDLLPRRRVVSDDDDDDDEPFSSPQMIDVRLGDDVITTQS